VARHIFQACPVWIYTQSNITQAYFLLIHACFPLLLCFLSKLIIIYYSAQLNCIHDAMF
jgi:hypothetical protein